MVDVDSAADQAPGASERAPEPPGFRLRLLGAVGLPLLLMAVMALLLAWQISQLLSAARLEDRADQIIARANQALQQTGELEAVFYEYLLTGHPSYRQAYVQVRPVLRNSLQTLDLMVEDRSERQQQIEAMRHTLEQWEQRAHPLVLERAGGRGGEGARGPGGEGEMGKGGDGERGRGGDAQIENQKPVIDNPPDPPAPFAPELSLTLLENQLSAFIAAEETVRGERNQMTQRMGRLVLGTSLGLSVLIGVIFAAFTLKQLRGLTLRYRQAMADAQRQSRAASASEQRLRVIFEMAAVGIAQVGPDGRWLQINQRLCDLTGYSGEELRQRRFQELTHPDDLEAELALRQRLLAGQESQYSIEKRYIRKDGSQVWVVETVSLVRSPSGGPEYSVSIVQDIGPRRAAQAAQEASEARLRLALEAAHMGTWEWDLGSGRIIWSDTKEALFGMAPGTFKGTFQAFLDRVHPEDRTSVEQAIRLALEGKATYRAEPRIVHPDGSIHWMAVRGDVLRDAQGKPTHMMGVAMDITERKFAEQERSELLNREQRARAEAEAANRRKDQFLAVLSHELRTPLTPVMARLALLKRDPALSRAAQSGLEMIRRNVELEARLIDDLLDMTRIARGKLHLNLETVDAHEKITDALEIYQADLAHKRLELKLDLRAEKHHVRADAARLQQVFWNLISNAVKYTPEGGTIEIRTVNSVASTDLSGRHLSSDGHRTAPNPPDPLLIIEVRDSGIGIEPEIMARLFDPFEQGEQTLTRRFGGLGLGLSISKTLVDMHGGRLSAASAGQGKGATFTVEFKTVSPTAVEVPAAPAPAPAAKRPLHILLVEDNEDTLRVMARLLKLNGYHVKTASSVKAALDLAVEADFDLVISDIGLPDGSGWELMRSLRKSKPVRGIALSGFSMDEDIQKSRSVGFMEHLSKPINPQELESAIQRVATWPPPEVLAKAEM